MTALPVDLDAALVAAADQPLLLVASDFDGVLAPIVEDRDAARPLPRSHEALTRLVGAGTARLALVSGRSLADLRRLADPPAGAVLIASHGAETDGAPPPLDDDARARLAAVVEALEAVVRAHPGTDLERKPAAGVLHTREADRDVAAAATRAAVDGPGRLPGVHTMLGKEVVEIAVVDTDKGTALEGLRARLGAGAVVYLGDDITDENVFRRLGPGDVGVKVGDGDTAAAHRVADPSAAADVLHRLADLLGR